MAFKQNESMRSIEMEDKKLYIFDLDGTLVTEWTDKLLPGRWEKLNKLADSGAKIAIATNQGGVGLRYWMEKEKWGNPSEYPTELDVYDRLSSVRSQLGIHFSQHICFYYETKRRKTGPIPDHAVNRKQWNPGYRKPDAGMLLEAMEMNMAEPHETIMIGDMPEDALAANKLGIDFMIAATFFEE